MAFLDFLATSLVVSLASLFLLKTFIQACRMKESTCNGCSLARPQAQAGCRRPPPPSESVSGL